MRKPSFVHLGLICYWLCSDRFIQTVSEYCTCLKEMPALAQDILRKLYELLRLFNNQVRLRRSTTGD